MRIRDASVITREIPLRAPYTIAYETIDRVTNHFLVLEMESGTHGVGCAAPAPEVTGETATDARRTLEQLAADLTGIRVHDIRTTTTRARRAFSHAPSACAALDLALFDARGRSEGRPVSSLIRGEPTGRTSFETSITIGISSVEDTLSAARNAIAGGFQLLKMKGGHDIRVDIERLLALSDSCANIRLALDANQGYNPDDVALLEKEIGHLELCYLEQPVPKDDLKSLARCRKPTRIPVMADEAARSVEHVRRIAELKAADLINIKLQKMGGLGVAEEIDTIAEDSGMSVMLGCMDESALSIAAALHFASRRPNVRFCDLDGHFDLTEDPFDGLVLLRDGRLEVGAGSGLGWSSPNW